VRLRVTAITWRLDATFCNCDRAENNDSLFLIAHQRPVYTNMRPLALVPNPLATVNPKPRTTHPTAAKAGASRQPIMGAPGPLRLFGPNKFAGGKIYESRTRTGYAGSYYCDACLQPVAGVYRVAGAVEQWLCAACGGQKAARRAAASTASVSPAPKVGIVITTPSRTRRTGLERSPRRRKPLRSPIPNRKDQAGDPLTC
jgi:hypothetical protein